MVSLIRHYTLTGGFSAHRPCAVKMWPVYGHLQAELELHVWPCQHHPDKLERGTAFSWVFKAKSICWKNNLLLLHNSKISILWNPILAAINGSWVQYSGFCWGGVPTLAVIYSCMCLFRPWMWKARALYLRLSRMYFTIKLHNLVRL